VCEQLTRLHCAIPRRKELRLGPAEFTRGLRLCGVQLPLRYLLNLHRQLDRLGSAYPNGGISLTDFSKWLAFPELVLHIAPIKCA
jgi:hypothetical protein